MNRSTKVFIAKTGLAFGLGIGAKLAGPEILDDTGDQPDSKPTIEWIGEATMAVTGLRVLYRGAIALGQRALDSEHKRIEETMSKLPRIQAVRNPALLYDYLAEHEPERLTDGMAWLVQPVIGAFRWSPVKGGLREVHAEMLAASVDNLREEFTRGISAKTLNSADVEAFQTACWFLDQTFPIHPDDDSVPVSADGTRSWSTYIVETTDIPPPPLMSHNG